MNIKEIAKFVNDEKAAIAFVEGLRWPNGPVCPHCGSGEKVYALEGKTTRAGLRKCGKCRKQFTVRVGTIFEDSHIPLGKWLYAIFQMCSSKKGVSANQLKRELGLTYKSAWFLCHRVRLAMSQPPLIGMLGSGGKTVEIDETYIGGKVSNNTRKQRLGSGHVGKAVVMTLIERDGEARTFHTPDARARSLRPVIRIAVSDTAHVVTDQYQAYFGIGKHVASHKVINHSKSYVRGIIHINFAESYHSLLKRGIFGTFHHVSEKHLSRYLREFEFKWNSRKVTDGERTSNAIRGALGKRLMYKTPLSSN